VKPTSPLYFTAYIKDVPVPRVQIDHGASLNLITLPALEELGISPSSHWSIYIWIWRRVPKTCGQDQDQIANRWSNFGSDILRYPRTSMLQPSSRRTTDSWQSCGPIYSSSVLQVCGYRQ